LSYPSAIADGKLTTSLKSSDIIELSISRKTLEMVSSLRRQKTAT